jgi:hypothetical protein
LVRRRCLALIVAAACGRIGFEARQPSGGGDDDGGGDAPASGDAGSGSCLDPGIGDSFDSATVCDWGSASGSNTTLTQTGGALLMTPTPEIMGASGTCARSGVPFTAAGVFVEVSAIITNFTSLEYVDGSGGDWGIETVGSGVVLPIGPTLEFFQASGEIGSGVPYDPVAMRWWRMRPVGGFVVFETAPDGLHWTVVTTSTDPAPTLGLAQVGTFVRTPGADPGVARFEGVDVCP